MRGRYVGLTMCRKKSGISFEDTICQRYFSITLLWGVIRSAECKIKNRETEHTGNTKKGNAIKLKIKLGSKAAEIAISSAAFKVLHKSLSQKSGICYTITEILSNGG